MLGSVSHWTKQNLINRLGLKKHLKRQLIMFYMIGNVTHNIRTEVNFGQVLPSEDCTLFQKVVQNVSNLVFQLFPPLD